MKKEIDYATLIREYIQTTDISIPAGSITNLKAQEIARIYLNPSEKRNLDTVIEDARQGIIEDWCSTYIEGVLDNERTYQIQHLEMGMEGDYYQCYEGDFEMRNLGHCSERLQIKVGPETYTAEDIEDLGIDIWDYAQFEAEYMTYTPERPVLAQTAGIGEIEIQICEDGFEDFYHWVRELDEEHLHSLQTSFSSPEDFDIDKEEIMLYIDMSYRFGCAYLDEDALTTELLRVVAKNEEEK